MLMTWYIPMVKQIAAKIAARLPSCALIDAGDLLSHGMFGLRDAIGKFDPNRGVKFTTYAPRRIHGAMTDGIREMDHVSRSMRRRGQVPEKLSLDKPVHRTDDGNDVLAHQFIAAAADGSLETRDAMAAICKGFNRCETLIIRLYYETDLTMKQIGRTVGFSESRVSQIHGHLLDRLRAKLTRENPEAANG